MYQRLVDVLGAGFAIATILGSFVYCAVGYIGLDEVFGFWWALGATFLLFFFRFTLPIALGVFYFVTDILDLHWFIGIIAAIPSLIIMFLNIIVSFIESRKTPIRRS